MLSDLAIAVRNRRVSHPEKGQAFDTLEMTMPRPVSCSQQLPSMPRLGVGQSDGGASVMEAALKEVLLACETPLQLLTQDTRLRDALEEDPVDPAKTLPKYSQNIASLVEHLTTLKREALQLPKREAETTLIEKLVEIRRDGILDAYLDGEAREGSLKFQTFSRFLSHPSIVSID